MSENNMPEAGPRLPVPQNIVVPTPRSTGAELRLIRAGEDIPTGAVYMDRTEVTNMHMEAVAQWKPRYEVWPFTFGLGILGGSAGTAGVIYISHFRRLFKLRGYGGFASYAPAIVLPCITSILTNNVLVTKPLLLREFTCPVCAEIRAMSIQFIVGIVQPAALAIFSCASLAKNYRTVAIPSFKDFRGWSTYMNKVGLPMKSSLLLIFALNLAGAAIVTRKQGEMAHKITKRLSN